MWSKINLPRFGGGTDIGLRELTFDQRPPRRQNVSFNNNTFLNGTQINKCTQQMYRGVCALVIYHRMQHIVNFYIRYIMSRHPYSKPTAFSWWCRPNCKKKVSLGLLNFTWGSWKLCVGSPTVFNFSKLVSTPGPSSVSIAQQPLGTVPYP